ncbi:MAG: proton-conducting transporter membrane subunit [Rhodospirillales bacterium]
MTGIFAGWSPGDVMVLALVLPVIGAFAVLALGRWENARDGASLITAICLFYVVTQLYPLVAAGGRPDIVLLDMVPGLSIRLTLEPLGMIFAGIASFLWIITTLYAIGYMRGHHEENQTRFFFFFAIAIASAIGVALAGNMLTLFVFYEVLSISTFPLVAHHGTEDAKRSGRVYLGILLSTSIGFLLFGMIWTWQIAGTLDFVLGGVFNADQLQGPMTAVLLALYAFGIGKAALMPFHRWLPAAMVAPTPVSALLHAVAVVKAGVFSVVKVVVYIFGIDFLDEASGTDFLLYVAGFTIIAASIVALRQDNLKLRLAYSTVSQLSYVVLGALLANDTAALGSSMHIAMHAFGKITLFFCAGAIIVFAHKTDISDMKGLGRKMPVTFFCFFLASMSLIGLPPMGGMWSKWYLALGAAEADQLIFTVVLMASSLLNIAYLMPVVLHGYFSQPPVDVISDHHHDDDDDHEHHHAPPNHPLLRHLSFGREGVADASLMCLLPIVVTTVGCILLFFYADKLRLLLLPVFGG